MRRIVDWLSTGLQPGLLLYGNLGTGKTALLRALYLLFSKYRHFSESVVMDSAASIVDAYARYERRQVTVIPTNLGDDLLCRTYGRRLWDRLNESYDMITFEGINFRTI